MLDVTQSSGLAANLAGKRAMAEDAPTSRPGEFSKVKIAAFFAVLMAIVFHKVPTAFALTSLLMLDRWKRASIVFWMSLFALATPLGAIVTWLFLRDAGSVMLALPLTSATVPRSVFVVVS